MTADLAAQIAAAIETGEARARHASQPLKREGDYCYGAPAFGCPRLPADPALELRRYAAARRVLELVERMRAHEAKRREMVPQSGFADDLRIYADDLEAALADSLGVGVSVE